MKKVLISTIIIFIIWFLFDWILHMNILSGAYEETKALWRPMDEMNKYMWVMWLICLVKAFSFTYIYSRFFSAKNLKNALIYGFILGFSFGIGQGYGSYASMPITYGLAFSWFLSAIIYYMVAGIIVAYLIKE